jgi:hypothetical protein
MSMRPIITLAELFGPDVVYVPRRSPSLHGWSPMAPGFVDFQTGHQLPVAGGIPYVACAGVATPDIRAMYAHAGLPLEAELHLYRTASDYLELISRFRAARMRLAVQRVHPAAEVPDALGVVPLRLQQDLNDKGRMADFVPSNWLPARSVVEVKNLPPSSDLVGAGDPIVLKAASRVPNGGGHCVWICRTADDVECARRALAVESLVVVEEFLKLRRTVCVHAIVLADGTVCVAGMAEEVSDGARYLGNWLDREADAVPREAIDMVERIVGTAACRGYRGIVGIDLAFLDDGSLKVLDLNFRVNGSTAAVWLRDGPGAGRPAACMRLRGWTAAEPDTLCRAARRAIDRGVLVPLGAYDPTACAMGGVPRLHGLVLGATREAVAEQEERLANDGLI